MFHKMNIKQMNKEIHYKCRCTGQRFTFKEWCNYLKGNPPKVVHTYKEFCFNIADVCLTPHIKRPLQNASYNLSFLNIFCTFIV